MVGVFRAWSSVDRWPVWLRRLAGAWSWLAALPLFSLILSTPPIVLADRSPAHHVVMVLCCLVTAAASPAWLHLRQAKTRPGLDLRTFCLVFLTPVLSLFLGYCAAVVSLPSVAALVAGQRVAFVVTVDDVGQQSVRGCRNPVYLHGMAVFFGRICPRMNDVTIGQTPWLAPGMQVMVTGRGHGTLMFADWIGPPDNRPQQGQDRTVAWTEPPLTK